MVSRASTEKEKQATESFYGFAKQIKVVDLEVKLTRFEFAWRQIQNGRIAQVVRAHAW